MYYKFFFNSDLKLCNLIKINFKTQNGSFVKKGYKNVKSKDNNGN